MALAVEAVTLRGLAKHLVQSRVIDNDTAIRAEAISTKEKKPLPLVLVEDFQQPALTIATTAAIAFGDPVLDLDAFDFSEAPKDLIKEELIRKHLALPLKRRGNRLFVAVCDPANISALEDIRFQTGINTEAIVVEADKLVKAIALFLTEEEDTTFDNLDDGLEDLDIEAVEDDGPDEDENTTDNSNDAPIVRFVNKLLLDAIKSGSSDLHFEPYEKSYRVRFRTDGVLEEAARPPFNLASKIAARLKVMAQLDITERRAPQDGRIKLKLSKTRAIDFRVNTCPTLFGEKVVLRILDPESAKLGIDVLGYESEQKKLFLEALHKPQGMCLVTGPTGSGKTVSLYTGVNILNTDERNISTAEDPVEINLEGVNQVNVNPKVGMDFSAALKAFLRQDPDIILVGEIRDLETANIAVKAAQTGHMVLSTLHTNSAPETLTRLRNMGVPSFNIATSVNLIIAQRLARRLCESCKKPVDIPNKALFEMGFLEEDIGFTPYGPKGCDKCNNGYKGRVGLYEVVKITPPIQRIIMEEGNAIQIADQCRKEGFNDLHRSGLIKVMAGVTSLEEVNRVTAG